ncbi:LysE family translocator [Telmatospirillum siberiense]|uniref:Lysine transporter LysE n=1 Tax=Telmatospirillum siberiense TaxID=382514 RepID=A0A2N3PY43_9PROT|nr:LysE family transporter [Telmatospirillum siberiense]PKU25332.1 lysine transporter LysE [Telmatospirillum siberiense]
MPSYLFLRGLAIGFALAAPVGPVGVLCVRRALADGRHAAFVAGLGAAFADTFYGAVAGLGLTVISSFLVSHNIFLRVTGGLILIILGIRSLRMPAAFEAAPACGPGLLKDFISTFLITLTNPGTILASMGVFAALGAFGQHDGVGAAAILILGVFSGSTLWWLILSAAASAARSRLSPRALNLLNSGSGVLLVLFGLGIIGSLAFNCL